MKTRYKIEVLICKYNIGSSIIYDIIYIWNNKLSNGNKNVIFFVL